jgi:preprotein translocase SecE subunit
MAAVTQKKDENMPEAAGDEENSDSDGGQERSEEKRTPVGPPRVVTKAGDGFFHIYKRGQGYWTRMGSVATAALIGLLTCGFIFDQCQQFGVRDSITYSVIGAFAAAFGLVGFYLFNRPVNVDFLIATDSEMKKVNWTSRKELVGSTKVVIGFMFFMAIVLYLYDQIFQIAFYLMHVSKIKPPYIP